MHSESNLVTILPCCDPAVAAGINAFSKACTPSHTTKSKKFSIWSLAKIYVEPPLAKYLSGRRLLIYLDCFGVDGLVEAVKKDGRAVEDSLRLQIQRQMKIRRDETFSDTLESLLYFIYFCKSLRTKRSVGESELKGAARKTLLHRFDGMHYPYCELCWRLCMKAENESENNNVRRFSARFCSEHDQSNPLSSYRTDHNYRDRYHKKLMEIYKEIPHKKNEWEKLAGDIDSVSIRKYAYAFVHSILVDDRLIVKRLADSGHTNAEIAKATGLSRQIIHKIMTIPLKSRYGRTSDGKIIDLRLLLN